MITDRFGFSRFMTPWNWGLWAGCDGGLDQGLRCYSDPEVNWMAPAYNACTLLGVDDRAAAGQPRVFPNPVPAQHLVHIQFGDLPAGEALMEVVDPMGRVCYRAKATGTSMEFRVAAPGLYLIRLVIAGLPPATQRLMVQ